MRQQKRVSPQSIIPRSYSWLTSRKDTPRVDISILGHKYLILDSFSLFRNNTSPVIFGRLCQIPLPWVDTLFIVRSLFLDPGKILCDQSRHELKENMCMKHLIYITFVQDAVEF